MPYSLSEMHDFHVAPMLFQVLGHKQSVAAVRPVLATLRPEIAPPVRRPERGVFLLPYLYQLSDHSRVGTFSLLSRLLHWHMPFVLQSSDHDTGRDALFIREPAYVRTPKCVIGY